MERPDLKDVIAITSQGDPAVGINGELVEVYYHGLSLWMPDEPSEIQEALRKDLEKLFGEWFDDKATVFFPWEHND